MNTVQNKLNELWASTINFYEFNILKHTIIFNVTVIENGKELKYEIKFKGVSSYHFFEDSGEKRINPIDPDDGDYLELTSIQFYINGIGYTTTKSKSEEWADQYYSDANFVLEIWNSILFIEAKTITINDVVYEINYPNN